MSQSPDSSTEGRTANDAPETGLGSVDDSLDAVFEVLVAERRRRALYVLHRRSGPVALSDLAEAVASREATAAERVAVSLHHVHLPKLAAANVVEYDREDRTVTLLDRSEQLYRHLSAAAESETESRPLRRAAGSATLSEFCGQSEESAGDRTA